jgi:hypothetical protein
VLSTVKQAFTEVGANGIPTAPPELVKGTRHNSGASSGARSRSTPRTLGILTERICAPSSSRSCMNDTRSRLTAQINVSAGIKCTMPPSRR